MRSNPIVAFVLAVATCLPAQGPRQDSPSELEAKSYHVLVFSRTADFRHASIPAGVRCVRELGARHGFLVDHTEDPTYFTDYQLRKYRVLVFLNTTGDVLSEPQQAAMERFVQAGGGFVGVHAAAATEKQWPWYRTLVGASYRDRPLVQTATVRVTDRDHPSTRHLDAEFRHRDEWYDFEDMAPGIRVVLKVDESSYDGGRHGSNHPIAWHHEVDGGRAFYTGLGATTDAFARRVFRDHLLGGIRWAAGPRILDYSRATTPPAIEQDPASTFHSPAESIQRIHLRPGLRLELVAAEPMVEEPVAVSWDGNGRMYVVELRGYMQNIDGKGEQDPVGRVVRLVDTDGDGRMDRRSVFLDKLVEPRAVLCLDDRVLVAEPPHVWECRDTDGDGVADEKISIYEGYSQRKGGNVEHKDNGLMWGLDNWIYNAKSSQKFRYTDGDFQKEGTPFRGQWGITQDDLGRIYFSDNSNPFRGAQIRLDYWKRARHTSLKQDRFAGSFKSVWPIIGTRDVQGGRGILRENESLSRFTACCGQVIYRGDRLPEEYRGNFFIPEPVGRLIRRGIIETDDGGMRAMRHPYEPEKGEFIASTDTNFRPVNMYTGPDGCLYIVDMYRGIIQHGNWVRKGSYLRKEVERREFDANIGRGRIYRVVHESTAPGAPPRLLDTSTAGLLPHLAHPNGWWRDEAQKLIVLRQDESVLPALRKMAREHGSDLGRMHALWTLEGLRTVTIDDVTHALTDAAPAVRIAGLRIGERFLAKAASCAKFLDAAAALAEDEKDVQVASQLILSIGDESMADDCATRANEIIAATAMRWFDSELAYYSVRASTTGREGILLGKIAGREGLDPTEPQTKRWLEGLTQTIIKDRKAEATAAMLHAAAESEPLAKLVIGKMADALPDGGRSGDKKIQLIKLAKKPMELDALKSAAGEKLTAKAMLWLTWPGEARYHMKSSFLPLNKAQQKLFNRGKVIFQGMCLACHGPNGKGLPLGKDLTMAPSLVGTKRVTGDKAAPIRILLNGLTGPIDGKTYPGQIMAPMASNDDEWIASVLTYVRREWGNLASTVTPEDVAKHRRQTAGREEPWTLPDLEGDKARAVFPVGAVADLPKKQPGLKYKVVLGNFDRLPDFGAKKSVKDGVSKTFDIGVSPKKDHFGVEFRGHIRIAEAGVYTFHTRADDGCQMFLDETLVVDGDTGKTKGFRTKGAALLQPGFYPLRITYFEKGGGEILEIEYTAPGKKGKKRLGADLLFHSDE